MTPLQARLYAARSLRAAREQEQFARQLRARVTIPTQRTARDATDDPGDDPGDDPRDDRGQSTAAPRLRLVPPPR